jgi:hypothetical protein
MFVRLALKVVMQSERDFVDVILLYPYNGQSCSLYSCHQPSDL